MPVEVSLELLVKIRGTWNVWPESLRGLVSKLEDNLKDRTQLLAMADWFQEHDEPGLERAFRYVAKRPGIEIEKDHRGHYQLSGVPSSVSSYWVETPDKQTLMGPIAELADKLRKHDADGE